MFRFSEIFHVAFELLIRRPAVLIPAVLVALLSLLLAGLGASASFGIDPESVESFLARTRQLGDLALFDFGTILITTGVIGVIIFLLTVILRHRLISPAITRGVQPHVARSLVSSCVIAALFLLPAAILALMAAALLTFFPAFTAFLVAIAAAPIIIVVLVLITVLFLSVAIVFRLSQLYAVSFTLSPLSALKLGASLFRTNIPTTLVAAGIITLSVAAFTGLTNLAILYTSRVSHLASSSALSVSLTLVVPAVLLGLATLLSEALWAAFFYLIARAPRKNRFLALSDEAVEKLNSPGTLPPQA